MHQADLRCLEYLRQIIEDMGAIIDKSNQLKEKQRFREEHSTPPLTLSLTQTREETAMVGFGDELIQLLDELTGHRSNLHIISIVGMGGMDDILSVEAWNEVRCFFPDNGSGSRIVLTTRLSDVANNCGSSCFLKNLLDENESWELFCKKAFQNEDCPTELEEIGRKIVKLCNGLALSIVVIGGRLLKSSRTVECWKSVAKDIELSPNSKEKQESFDVLFSSYDHLPPHLKPCFLYIGVL
ncbi:putative late blight resistance protein homolog R1A-10 [Salvia miltiorrhiza]|uniref:putative late blight resistance protein homolog R1A-10 n=1 Tax=Salvia miltiorrhiza TaxID=226208 RepID=UPI0025AD2FF3|nr:putative late blight resistance protein homolog R1A-10 [Salvia miltiorrhiza]